MGQGEKGKPGIVAGFRGVRYQVKDVERAVAFYTRHLGFKLEPFRGPPPRPGAAAAFAEISIDGVSILLSGPGASGSRPLPDGRRQEPGGWNRVVLRVDDLAESIKGLKEAGLRFRNELEAGPGGKQIQLEDPDGNPIELFEPAHQPKEGKP